MITIKIGCTFLTDQCKTEYPSPFEVFLSPDTMMLIAMRQATDTGWTFASHDPGRALCPAHSDSHRGDFAPLRVFQQLNRIPGTHGLVMVGLEECMDHKLRLAIGASRSPEPAGLVRLQRTDAVQLLSMIHDGLDVAAKAREGA